MAYVVTPNLYEASILTGTEVTDLSTMRAATEKMHAMGPQYVICKGGHLPNRAMDRYLRLLDRNFANVTLLKTLAPFPGETAAGPVEPR